MRTSVIILILAVLGICGYTRGTEPSSQHGPPRDAVAEYCPNGVFERPKACYRPEPPAGILWELCAGRYLERVVARLDVDAEGRVEAVHLLKGSGCPAVDAEIERCWSKWRYQPARCDASPIGIPVYFYTQWHRVAAPAKSEVDYCPDLEELESIGDLPRSPGDVTRCP
ncbi:MAG: energy transducer TonB [bacterium]|nr:energy transducer TonB [bacterium]